MATLVYLSVIFFFVILAIVISVFFIWLIAHTNTFFSFINEGEGIAIMSGESLHKLKISFRGHRLEQNDEDGVNAYKVIEVAKGKEGKGPLENLLGIYWIGVYPFRNMHEYEFRWSEWGTKSKNVYELERRVETTKVYFVKTFAYAMELESAQTGGDGGNVPVNVKFSLFVRIIYPEIAIFRNDDWFSQLNSIVLNKARTYVGERTYEQLREEKGGEKDTSFSKLIKELNKTTVDEGSGVIQSLGVEIIKSPITTVDIVGDDKVKIERAATEVYRRGQEALGIRITADATRYAIQEEIAGVDSSPSGAFVRRQQALERAGAGRNTVVFSDRKEKGGPDEALAAFTSRLPLDKDGPEPDTEGENDE